MIDTIDLWNIQVNITTDKGFLLGYKKCLIMILDKMFLSDKDKMLIK